MVLSSPQDLKDDRSDEEEEDSVTDNEEESTKNGSKNGCGSSKHLLNSSHQQPPPAPPPAAISTPFLTQPTGQNLSQKAYERLIDLLLATGPGKKPSLQERQKLHNMTKCVNGPLSEQSLNV